jgi:hypothetical protein
VAFYSDIALKNLNITPILTKNPSLEKFWNMIISQICEDTPLILSEYSGGGGHEKLIYGYEDKTEDDPIQWVWVYDTADPPDPDPSTGLVQAGLQRNLEFLWFADRATDPYGRDEIYVTQSYPGN